MRRRRPALRVRGALLAAAYLATALSFEAAAWHPCPHHDGMLRVPAPAVAVAPRALAAGPMAMRGGHSRPCDGTGACTCVGKCVTPQREHLAARGTPALPLGVAARPTSTPPASEAEPAPRPRLQPPSHAPPVPV